MADMIAKVSLIINLVLTGYCTMLWLSTRKALWRIEATKLTRLQKDLDAVRSMRDKLEQEES